MRKSLIAAAFLVAGCGGAGSGSNDVAVANAAGGETPIARSVARAKAVSINEKTDLLDWHLGYPAEVSAIPKLEALIRDPALEKKAELLSAARDDKASRGKEGFPFNSYEASTDYSVTGNSPRLLSLAAEWFEFTGGAHPNHGTIGLLWDKTGNRPVTVAELLGGGAAALQSLFGSAYCKALDKERAKKREGESGGGPNDPFNACPKFSELQFIPKSAGGSAALTTILIHADPYVAGPYVEGDYDVELPVTDAMVAALRPDYRSSFAPAR